MVPSVERFPGPWWRESTSDDPGRAQEAHE